MTPLTPLQRRRKWLANPENRKRDALASRRRYRAKVKKLREFVQTLLPL